MIHPTDLQLFKRTVSDLEAFVLAQDVIYVGGGNVANLLAVGARTGSTRFCRKLWERGIVLCGVSAGMNCWFEQSVTDSFDLNQLRALDDGLGILPGAAARITMANLNDARPTSNSSDQASSLPGGRPTTAPRSSSLTGLRTRGGVLSPNRLRDRAPAPPWRT